MVGPVRVEAYLPSTNERGSRSTYTPHWSAKGQADFQRLVDLRHPVVAQRSSSSGESRLVESHQLGEVDHRLVLQAALPAIEHHGDRIRFERGRHRSDDGGCRMLISDIVL